jgi:hypothetical protein
VQNVVDNNYNDTIESTFIKNLRDRLGSEIKIEIKKLKEISLGPNGKFKAVERKFSLQ